MARIVIDYTPAIRQRAGIGRIIRGQVQALLELNPGYEVHLFLAGPATAAERAEAPLPLAATPISERNLVRIWHRLNLPWPPVEWFTTGSLDLFHATDFVLAPNHARHQLVTVHDLAFLFYPEAALPSLHRYLNVVVPRSVRRADHILADSQHTANDLHEQWQIPLERITVVQGAVDHTHFRPVTDQAQLAAVRRRYSGDDRPFILGLSSLQPRKNFVRLIEAFALARQAGGLPHRLVIGGGKGWLYEEIFARVRELDLTEHVCFPGYVAEADLPALYCAAEFFAYPSLYEGFGLPGTESRAWGTAGLTADNSCLPEAGGPGAYYVKAEAVESIAEGILNLAQDAALRARLSVAGQHHAAQFTWQRSAQQLLAAYQRVLENCTHG